MQEGPPRSAPACLGHVHPSSSAGHVHLQETDSAGTTLSKSGNAVGEIRGPRATTAVEAAVRDGETDSADSLVLQNLTQLREQLETLAKNLEHNHRSLLEAIGIFPANSNPSTPAKAFPASSHEPALNMPAGAPARVRLAVVDDGDANSPLTPVSPGYQDVCGADGPRVASLSAGENNDGGQELMGNVEVEHVQSKSTSGWEVHDLYGVKDQLTEHKSSIMRTDQGRHRKDIHGWAMSLSKTSQFETTVAFSILSNAVVIGWNSDWSMKNRGSDRPIVFIVLDWLFLVIFLLELALRIVAEGFTFFQYRSKMFGWNVFDCLVIAFTLLNNAGVVGVRLSVVRVFRVLRLVHVIRLTRLKSSFRELRMMVDGIMNCGKTLLWSFLLLIVITFIYAVVCLELMAEWLTQAEQQPMSSIADLGQAELEAKVSTIQFVTDNYTSLPYSIYTLFKAVSGGVSWGELSDPMEHVNIVLLLTFPLFIGVTVFCVLNIITAAFVDAAARQAKEEETNALEYIAEKKAWIRNILNIFKRHDADSCGALDFEEFSSIMADWRTQAALTGMGIDMSFQQAKALFNLFDWNGDGQIDTNEFAQGIHHLKGPARSLDVLRHFMKLSRQIDKLASSLAKHDKSKPDPMTCHYSQSSSVSSGLRCA